MLLPAGLPGVLHAVALDAEGHDACLVLRRSVILATNDVESVRGCGGCSLPVVVRLVIGG